ncbi:hypothetical protein ACJJTC_018219 [Scirpophaga incertulas]
MARTRPGDIILSTQRTKTNQDTPNLPNAIPVESENDYLECRINIRGGGELPTAQAPSIYCRRDAGANGAPSPSPIENEMETDVSPTQSIMLSWAKQAPVSATLTLLGTPLP